MNLKKKLETSNKAYNLEIFMEKYKVETFLIYQENLTNYHSLIWLNEIS